MLGGLLNPGLGVIAKGGNPGKYAAAPEKMKRKSLYLKKLKTINQLALGKTVKLNF